jgi:hypothetical protein
LKLLSVLYPETNQNPAEIVPPGLRGLLDNQRLAVLADLAEESACCAGELLAHLRDPNAAHLAGCWAVEAVFGRVEAARL